MSLMAYKDSRFVDESEVIKVPEPEFTKTWHPISHAKVITSLEEACRALGLEVENRNYSMTNDGLNMFGAWRLAKVNAGINHAIGFRNSMKKHFAVGICAGTNVIVCDNLAFTSDWVEFRRHTGRLDVDELNRLAKNAVKSVEIKLEGFMKWHQGLKNYDVSPDDLKILTYDFMKEGVFPPSRFTKFINAIREERAVNAEHDQTLYDVHGAVTRVSREDHLFNVSKRNRIMNELLDKWMELKDPDQREGFWRKHLKKFPLIAF